MASANFENPNENDGARGCVLAILVALFIYTLIAYGYSKL